jgi:hypothetical protein
MKMKMIISKGGTDKNKNQQNHVPMQKLKKGTDKKKHILSLYENENLKRGDRKKTHKKT